MKRRIIAALTALVMVVTMIPSSAFAASTDSVKQMNATMEVVFENAGASSDKNAANYEDREKVTEVFKTYSDLKGTEDALEGFLYEEELNAAMNAFTQVDITSKAFKEAMNALGRQSVKAINDEKLNAAYELFTALAEIKSVDPKDAFTVKAPKATSTADIETVFGTTNYKAIQGLVDDGYTGKNTSSGAAFNIVSNIAKLVPVTDDAIDAIEAKNVDKDGKLSGVTFATDYNAVTEGLSDTTFHGRDYAYLVDGSDRYEAIAKKVAEFTAVSDQETELTKVITLTGKNTLEKLQYIDKMDATTYAKFEKAMADSKTLVESDKASATFVALYKATDEVYEKFLTKAATAEAIGQLPSVDAINNTLGMDALVEAYAEWLSIDADVAAITTMDGVYKAVGSALKTKLGKYETITAFAAEYAKIVDKAIKEVEVAPGYANIDKIDDAISAILNYKEAISTIFAGKPDASTEKTNVKVAVTDKFDSKLDVTSWSKKTKKTNALDAKDLDNTALIKEMEKDSFAKLVAASDYVIAKSVADVETFKALAGNLNKVAGEIPATIETEKDYEKAETALNDYNKGYAALNAEQKAQYDKLVKDENAVVGTVEDSIEKINKAMEAYASPEDRELAKIVIQNIDEFNKFMSDYKAEIISTSSAKYPVAVAKINAIELGMAKESVKKLVEDYDEFDTYTANKKYIGSLDFANTAIAAVVKAIDSLKVLDDEALKTLTREGLDAAISAYNTVENSYLALTPVEKANVTNVAHKEKVYNSIVDGVKVVFVKEVAKIGVVAEGTPLTSDQKLAINNVKMYMEQYKTYKVDFENDAVTEAAFDKYEIASAILDGETASAAQKEFEAIEPLLAKVKTLYLTGSAASEYYIVNKNSAKMIVEAVDKYNALSDEAKEIAQKSAYRVDKLVYAYADAKSLILDYAVVEVADVEYDGTVATPEVVVKDFRGRVIPASEYEVTYSSNEKPGTAKVHVTAVATGKYIGSVVKDFKIIAKELAKVENVKFDTDYGIVRVYFDRTADIDGIDVRYQVQYKKTTSDKWITKYPTKGLDYLTLKNLTKNGKYDVRVRAYTDDYGTERVYGEYSDVQTVYANRNGAKSGIMYKAVIKNLTTKNGSVTMTVNPVKYQTVPQGVTWKYSYKKYGSQYTTWSTAKTTKNTSYTFKNLKKGTRYVFRAQYTYTSAVDGKTAVNSNYSVYKNIVVK